MADEIPTFQFEDVPLDEARRMGRGPRMEPMLYDTLRQKIRSLSTPTVCLDVTSLVVCSYGYDNGKSGPTRCALIGAALGDRCRGC
jgi:hypothetical protein